MTQDSDLQTDAPRETIKQRFLAKRDQPLSKDYFLYSCLEHERFLKTKQTDLPIRWDGVDRLSSADSPEEAIIAAIKWHLDADPELGQLTIVNHEACTKAVPLVVGICQDIATINQKILSQPLPEIVPGSAISDQWKSIFKVLNQKLGLLGSYAEQFLRWSYSNPVEEVVEPGSRPPVGKYAPPLMPRDKRPNGRANPRQDSFSKRGKPEHKPQNKELKKPSHHKKTNDHADGKGQALKEVEQALDSLRNDGSVQEIILKPTNSFLRRLQHQVAVDSGFKSESTGEGPDRAVKISRG